MKCFFLNSGEHLTKQKMTANYTTNQKKVMDALRELYEAEGLKGLREVKKHHTEFINKCAFLEKEGDRLDAAASKEHKTLKTAYGYLKRFARESNWSIKRNEKANKVPAKRGRPIDFAKRDLKKKEKVLKKMLRIAQTNQRLLKNTFKDFKRNKREALAAAKKEEKANKPKGKPGRKKKVTTVVEGQPEGEDLIAALLAQASQSEESQDSQADRSDLCDSSSDE